VLESTCFDGVHMGSIQVLPAFFANLSLSLSCFLMVVVPLSFDMVYNHWGSQMVKSGPVSLYHFQGCLSED